MMISSRVIRLDHEAEACVLREGRRILVDPALIQQILRIFLVRLATEYRMSEVVALVERYRGRVGYNRGKRLPKTVEWGPPVPPEEAAS